MPIAVTHRGLMLATCCLLLSACQAPPQERGRGADRAAFSEWDCAGEPMLAQFYGSRVVISDSSSSRWLDRGTQVGQVFRSDDHSIRFRGDTATWTSYDESVECTPRELPDTWQQAREQGDQRLHFMAQGPQAQWVFKLQGKQAILRHQEDDTYRSLPAGDADYYLDMWTYNIQTPQDRMRIEIIDGLCRNQQDQIPYPSSIQINWNDQVLQGCGRWLAKADYRP